MEDRKKKVVKESILDESSFDCLIKKRPAGD
jgi:hypothetical protein